jgi:hypothetical protein
MWDAFKLRAGPFEGLWGRQGCGDVDHPNSGHVKRLRALLNSLRSQWIPEAEIRAEVWALGGRHRGEVVEGARSELKAPGITVRRSMLLLAVIRKRAGDHPVTYGPRAVAKRNDEEADG